MGALGRTIRFNMNKFNDLGIKWRCDRRFRTLIEQAPVATCLFVGHNLVIEIANEAMITFFGQGRSILNKPIRDVLTNTDADRAAVSFP